MSAPRPSVSARSFAGHRSCGDRGRKSRRIAFDSSRREGIVSVATMVHPRSFSSMVKMRPIGPWPCTSTTSSGCGSHCSTAFKQVLTGSTNGRGFERNAVRNLFHAALDDPIHHAHVLSEAAARGLEARRDAHFLIDRALGIKFARQ